MIIARDVVFGMIAVAGVHEICGREDGCGDAAGGLIVKAGEVTGEGGVDEVGFIGGAVGRRFFMSGEGDDEPGDDRTK